MNVATTVRGASDLQRLEALYEVPALPAFDLSEQLTAAYGGRLGFQRPRRYANFVTSVDGAAAIPHELQSSHLNPEILRRLLRSACWARNKRAGAADSNRRPAMTRIL
jgi:hypothetical protein